MADKNRVGARRRGRSGRGGGEAGIPLAKVTGTGGTVFHGRVDASKHTTSRAEERPPRLVFAQPVTAVVRNPLIEARLRGNAPNRKLIGEYLLDLGIIAPDALAGALAEQVKTGGLLGEILLAKGEIEATSLPLVLAHQHDLPSFVPEYQAAAVLPRSVAYGSRVAVLVGPAGGQNAPATLAAVTDVRSLPNVAIGLGVPLAPRLVDSRTMDRLLADAYAEVDGKATNAALRAARKRRLRSLGLVSCFVSLTAHHRRPVGSVVLSGVTRSGARAAPPEHSLLLILNHETVGSLSRLCYHLDQIDYPRHRLQALAVYDPADRATRRALREGALPDWVTVLAAPHNLARGRRSLTLYALRQARGATLTLAQARTRLDARVPHFPAEGRRPIRERFLRQADPRLFRSQPGSFSTARLLAAFDWTGDTACASDHEAS